MGTSSINRFRSGNLKISSGILQNSNLGPLLFSTFLNAPFLRLKCESLVYADNLKIYSIINCYVDCFKLQTNLAINIVLVPIQSKERIKLVTCGCSLTGL